MRDIFAVRLERAAARAMCMLAALALGFVPNASAQQGGERWTSPDGAVTVTIPQGWEHIEHWLSQAPLFAIGPAPEVARREGRALGMCGIDRREINSAQMAQEPINQRVNGMLAPAMAELRPIVVHRSRVDVVGGVAILFIDIDERRTEGVGRLRQKVFMLPASSGVIQYTIICSGSAQADVEVQEMFMELLIVHSGTTP